MTKEKYTVQDLGHRIQGVGCATDLKEFHKSAVDPFLRSEVL
jgi:hypothetical protein